jgi:hypothetical protein
MFRFTSFFAVATAALFLTWSTSDAQAQCYQPPFHGARSGYYHVQPHYYAVPVYRPSVNVNFGAPPVSPYHRHYYSRPAYGYGYGHGHAYGHGRNFGSGGWSGSGITIRF